jgi:Uma2 family endonuclease
MSTATISEPPHERSADRSVVLRRISWAGYQTILQELGDDATRLTYDNGFLEIELPGKRHEELKSLAGALVEAVLNFRRVLYASLGSTTWNRSEKLKGIEADQCYYLGDAADGVIGKDRIDTAVDPAPNLAIEVDVTASSVDKLGIYAAIGVREVWRIDDRGGVTFLVPGPAGEYQVAAESRELPGLRSAVLTEHLQLLDTLGHARVVWQFTDRLPQLLGTG